MWQMCGQFCGGVLNSAFYKGRYTNSSDIIYIGSPFLIQIKSRLVFD
jgi:hypothetical protein